jgi:rhodanese-related sulfurtransferase
MTRDEFVKEVTDGLAPPPQYFPKNAMINKNGYESIDTVIERGTLALDPQAFEDATEATEALILDTRNAAQFVKAHMPGSIFIGIDGGFAPWVGALITDIEQPILIVTDPGREEEVVTRLARVGYDHTLGYLKGGLEAWIKAGKEVDQIESISSEKFAEIYAAEPIQISDVRKCSEYDNGHVVNALNFPLDFIAENTNKYDKDEKYYVHCAGGYRSVIAASILKSRGYHNLVNVEGGYAAIKNTSIPTEISESVAS